MYLSIDFGGSTVDVAWWEVLGGHFIFKEIKSFERHQFPPNFDLGVFFHACKISLTGITEIFVTGGKSRFLPSNFLDISIIKIPEIEAIGRGGWYFLNSEDSLKKLRDRENVLVVSMGTGTCIVQLQQKDGVYWKSIHIGGTGVGGGTFLGLCNSLLHETDIDQVKKLFQRGDKTKVDLSVGDIIGGDIGKISASATASNLARLSREIDFSRADIASGIVNLVGQTIGIVASFAARNYDTSFVLLTGKLTGIEKIVDVIFDTASIYKVPMLVPKNAAFVSTLGAGVFGIGMENEKV